MLKILGLTGKMATGKSYCLEQFKKIGLKENIKLQTIETDLIRRDILKNKNNSSYVAIRKKVIEQFQIKNFGFNYALSGDLLGEIIFSNQHHYQCYKKIINPIIKQQIKERIKTNSDIVIVEWANIIEDNFLDLVNKNILITSCSKQLQMKRLKNADLPAKQIKDRINKQLSIKQKIKLIKQSKIKQSKGYLKVFSTNNNPPNSTYKKLFFEIYYAIN